MDPASGGKRDKIVVLPLEDARAARGESRRAVARSKVATLRAFQRIRADRLWGVLGIVFVLFATVLVLTWEHKPAPEPKVALTWREDPASLPEVNRTVTETQPTLVVPFEVTAANVTRVRVNVYWKDDVATQSVELDNLSLKLEGPEGTNVVLQRGALSCCLDTGTNETFSVRVQDPPEAPSQFPVRTVGEAERMLGDRTSHVGSGLWKLTVTLNQANGHYANELQRGSPCPDGGPPSVCIPDHGNWFRVRLSYNTYHPEFRAGA